MMTWREFIEKRDEAGGYNNPLFHTNKVNDSMAQRRIRAWAPTWTYPTKWDMLSDHMHNLSIWSNRDWPIDRRANDFVRKVLTGETRYSPYGYGSATTSRPYEWAVDHLQRLDSPTLFKPQDAFYNKTQDIIKSDDYEDINVIGDIPKGTLWDRYNKITTKTPTTTEESQSSDPVSIPHAATTTQATSMAANMPNKPITFKRRLTNYMQNPKIFYGALGLAGLTGVIAVAAILRRKRAKKKEKSENNDL